MELYRLTLSEIDNVIMECNNKLLSTMKDTRDQYNDIKSKHYTNTNYSTHIQQYKNSTASSCNLLDLKRVSQTALTFENFNERVNAQQQSVNNQRF
jgi:hypothetical protein